MNIENEIIRRNIKAIINRLEEFNSVCDFKKVVDELCRAGIGKGVYEIHDLCLVLDILGLCENIIKLK